MASIPSKDMLAKILKTATLSAKEREIFEGMWDSVHRYGKLTRKQNAWIEDVYYKQKLDQANRPAPVKTSKRGRIDVPGLAQPVTAHSLERFLYYWPEADQETIKRVTKFFKSGGQVIELRPKA